MIGQTQHLQFKKSAVAVNLQSTILNPIHRLPLPLLLVSATSIVGLDAVLHGPALLSTIVLAGCASLFWRKRFAPGRASRQLTLTPKLAVAGLLGLFFLATLLATPAQAQFFGTAETWLQSNFGSAAGDAIPLVFNVLRGLFLLYVGVSLIRVVNSARHDEDWQTIARTPLIVVIAVTAADILTGLITG